MNFSKHYCDTFQTGSIYENSIEISCWVPSSTSSFIIVVCLSNGIYNKITQNGSHKTHDSSEIINLLF